jgi:D-lactate dehydrogenase
MPEVAVYDTKPYDREYLTAASDGRIRWRFHEFRLGPATVGAATGSKAVCIFVNDKVDATVCGRLADAGVRLIALRCAGFNNVDVTAARAAGLAVVRVPAYSPHAVAEHAVALLLALNRKLHRAYSRVRELNFSLTGLVGANVQGKTVGVVGTGKIGRLAAQIFRGFDAEVLAYDPMPAPEWAAQHRVRYVELPALLAASDILTLHLPLLPETKHLLNATTLAQTKRGVTIINTSRGKLIDTRALIHALKKGHVGGVALDVYEEEEGIFFEDLSGQVLQDDTLSRLLTFPNVLITAHQGFFTREALAEIGRVTVENILALDRGAAFLPGTTL